MINATTSSTSTSSTGTTSASSSVAGGSLGKDDFLKLLTTQLQHQDPMNPTDDTSFIGQMAQFSALEQTTNMATALNRYGTSQQVAQSIGLIGHEIDASDENGSPLTGTVSSVTINSDGSTSLAVGTASVLPNTVTRVK